MNEWNRLKAEISNSTLILIGLLRRVIILVDKNNKTKHYFFKIKSAVERPREGEIPLRLAPHPLKIKIMHRNHIDIRK